MLRRPRLAIATITVTCAALVLAGAPAAGAGTRPAAAANAKKGVSAWTFNGVDRALEKSGASWYYTWGSATRASPPERVQFVPMIWGAGSVTTANLREVSREGHYLLGFNEPDNPGQSDMSVAQALACGRGSWRPGCALAARRSRPTPRRPAAGLTSSCAAPARGITGSTSSPCTGTAATSRRTPRSGS